MSLDREVCEVDEAGLIASAQAGDGSALGELLLQHQEACYALAVRLSGSPADADDVCQDAFVRASRDIGLYRPIGSFRSWLFALVVHSHRNRQFSDEARRQRERGHGMIASGGTASAASSGLERQELRRHLDMSLGQLDEDYRLPIVLHHEQGLTCAEAARVLGMPEGTVKTNIKRGLEELKGMMAAAGYTCTVPVMTGALAEGLAVSVPAGLTAFIQSLTVAAESGAAAVGKAAAGAALKISARLGAKKAAGLALGWKVGTVLTAAAVGGAAVVAVNSGMFDAKPAVPVVTVPEGPKPSPLPPSDYAPGPIIFEDNFDQGLGNWEPLIGKDLGSFGPGGEEIAGAFYLPPPGKGRRFPELAGVIEDSERHGMVGIAKPELTRSGVVCLRAKMPVPEGAFSVQTFILGAGRQIVTTPFPWETLLREERNQRRSLLPENYSFRWDYVPAGTDRGGNPLFESRTYLKDLKHKPPGVEGLLWTRLVACADRRIGIVFCNGEMKLVRVEVRRLEKRQAEGGAR